MLQAADILAYDSDTVPVGEDQVQHIEVCRDLAGSFNHEFGDVFVMPKAYVLETSARVPGTELVVNIKWYETITDYWRYSHSANRRTDTGMFYSFPAHTITDIRNFNGNPKHQAGGRQPRLQPGVRQRLGLRLPAERSSTAHDHKAKRPRPKCCQPAGNFTHRALALAPTPGAR